MVFLLIFFRFLEGGRKYMSEKSFLELALDTVHEKIIRQLNVEQEKALAAQLQKLFNKVLYDKDWNEALPTEILLQQELAEDIQAKLRTKKIREKIQSDKAWQVFENKISYIVQQSLNKAFNTKVPFKKITTGKDINIVNLEDLNQASFQVREWIESQLALAHKDKIIHTIGKSGKSDVAFTFSSEVKSEYQELYNNFTFSVKNYSGKVKLEAVNPLKAYIAIMNNYKQLLNGLNIYDAYYKYYVSGEIPTKKEVNIHLNHIANIYGLVGLGNISVLTGKISSLTRFLVLNTKHSIQVYSTAEIIEDIISEDKGKKYGVQVQEHYRKSKHAMRYLVQL